MANPKGYNQYQEGPGSNLAKRTKNLLARANDFLYGKTTTTNHITGKVTTSKGTDVKTRVNRGTAPKKNGVTTKSSGGLMGFGR